MRNLVITLLGCLALSGVIMATASTDSRAEAPAMKASSVPEAVEKITRRLEQQGHEIVLVVDHEAAAASVGLDLAPTQVIFARPPRMIELAFLVRSRTIGIDLPLKFLVFERDGEVHVNVNPVGYLVDRNDVAIRDSLLRWLDFRVEQFAQSPAGIVTIESVQSFEKTVQGLQDAIMSNPAFRIPLVLDYGVDRKEIPYFAKRRHPVLIIFGNPNAGTSLMQANQEIGIDLPQKYLVWEDREGRVNISYNDPFFIASRHHVHDQDDRLETIAGALRRFALIGAGR